jgi:hypothetical protein
VKDPYGTVLVLIRDDPAVTAIVGQKVSGSAEAPPSVQLIDNASTRRPFGVGSSGLGLQYWQGFARCYGPDNDTGAITARQLAGAVSDALHLHPAYRGSTFILRTYAPDIDGLSRDPDTHWPYYEVRLEVYAAAQAVA